MSVVNLLLALTADTLAHDLDAWVPQRLAAVHAAAVGVAVVSKDGTWEWYHGVENVLTRTRVGPETSWPVRAFSSSSSNVAAPHSRIGIVLTPGLVVLGVWTALAWIVLIPVSALTRRKWRIGPWHEVLAILIAVPLSWIFLRRLAGPVLATYFTALAAALLLVASTLAAITWKKSRVAAMALVVAAGLAAWAVRGFAIPLPANFDGGPPEGATLAQLEQAVLHALPADSLQRTGMGFSRIGSRWIAHDRSRGAEAFLVLLPSRELGMIVVSNSGEMAGLLEEIVDTLAR